MDKQKTQIFKPVNLSRWLIVLLLILISIGIIFEVLNFSKTINSHLEKGQVFLWHGEIIYSQRCSPSEGNVCTDKELQTAISEFKSNFKEGEIKITEPRPGKNGFYYQATDNAYQKMKNFRQNVIFKKTNVSFHYSGPYIDKSEQKTPLFNYEQYTCATDSDCISVDADSCGCTAMGKATAINRKYYTYWENAKKENSKGRMCPMSISSDSTCSASPKCTNNTCQLVN